MKRIESLTPLAIALIAVVVLVAALSIADSFFAPVTLAIVAGVVLSPISDFWEKIGFPRAFGAMVSMLSTLIMTAVVIIALQPQFMRLIEQAPKVMSDITETVSHLRNSFQGLADMSEEVSAALGTEQTPDTATKTGPDANMDGPPPPPAPDTSEVPTLTDALLLAPSIFAQIVIFAGTLFFFLATRRDVYAWVAKHIPTTRAKGVSQNDLMRADRLVSKYFLTITLINAGLGAATALVLTGLGLPGGAQWGLLAFFANFVVYLGPAFFVGTMVLVGIAAFDGPMALAPAASFLFLNFIEGQFVTPSLVGQTMRINPLAIFLAVIFGLWLWGAAGGIVAIPLLVWGLFLNGLSQKTEA
ncbi:MAG: AI-2E family transporter [Paracoccaceae bacterium]